ncbi:Cof-type HAD-IIB family hydrolase [Metabacillus fastidiosus]|uniref:Cof-type HAD-IIB family hydrolase n=1 Tax=Metabacillus fastidiosus TaxID=1458 RepID=UPI003D264D4C
MNEKVIFFDIDGTILNHQNKIPESTKEAVERLKEEGHHVAIATGRAPFMFKDIREELGIDSFVSYNGQYVVFEGQPIYENPLVTTTIESLLPDADEAEHPLIFMGDGKMMSTVAEHPYIKESLQSLGFTPPAVDREFFRNHPIYQILLFCKDRQEEQYKCYDDLQFIRWHEFSVDIIPAGGSKAEGIKRLIERLKINREDVYAFGDGPNDYEMISYVGTGVAMGNAVPKLKELADFVTKPVDEDGILYGLEQLKLLK